MAKVPAAWITAIVGFCALWLAAFTEVIGNWGFVAGLFVGLLGVAPLLPYVFGSDESGPAEVGIAEGGTAKNVSSRRAVALILGVAVVGAFTLSIRTPRSVATDFGSSSSSCRVWCLVGCCWVSPASKIPEKPRPSTPMTSA